MKNYVFKSEEDFKSKQEDVLILIKKVKDRLMYIADTAAKIMNTENKEMFGFKEKEIFIATDIIFNIDAYEDDIEFIQYHMDIFFNKNTLFKDKFGTEMDLRYQMPRRWLNEDFEEELKNGLFIKKDEVLENTIKDRDFVINLAKSLNLTEEQENILGISQKIKEVSDAVEYYNY
jgi:hypothetical protein